MDSNRIKKLATGVRATLRNEVSARLDSILAEGSRERLESPARVSAIAEDLKAHGREEVVDRAAYTWFNRLCALRFMDVNGYTPVPVVTPRGGQTQPAILADVAQGLFDPEYDMSVETKQSIAAVLTGSKASANAAEDAYSLLLQAVCEHYAKPMPYLFAEGVTSSLLMPQGLLAEGSILSRIVSEMDEDACSSVEVLGWLYQFYIAERKDEVFANYKRRKKAEAADIAPATQLFTPDWIVRYMTENTLGRLWVLNNTGSELAESMDFYIAPEGEEPFIHVDSAEEIRVLDPACGSGHILVYAFDLLMRMYEEDGWDPEDAASMILENNLFGLEIDQRAAEIASFALEMKAREYDQRFLEKDIDAHIMVLKPVTLDAQELLLVPQLAQREELLDAMSHLDQIGSLCVPDSWSEFTIQNELEHIQHDGSLFAESLMAKLKLMLANVQALSKSYHCVIANPPYMGSGNMNSWLSKWIKLNYPEYKSDLFSAFISRNYTFAKDKGELGFMSPYVWMFISSYEYLRNVLIEEKTITSLIQLEYSGFAEATVPVCTFTVTNQCVHSYRGGYVRLTDFVGAQIQAQMALEAINNPNCTWFYRADTEDFKAIPGWPIAYWVSDAFFVSCRTLDQIGKLVPVKKGLDTGDNARFLRYWFEVAHEKMGIGLTRDQFNCQNKKWAGHDKGGDFRRWYGNREWVINWEHDGEELKKSTANLRSQQYYFSDAITWSSLSSGLVSFRLSNYGAISNTAGSSMYPNTLYEYYLGYTNSSVYQHFLEVFSPTLNYSAGPVGLVPIRIDDAKDSNVVTRLVNECVSLSRSDWDAFETSWDFARHPLTWIPSGMPERLSDCFSRWESECRDRFDRLKANEEELNRIFARIYHMEDEVPIEVPDDKVSVRLADLSRDARSLISYGVGCMFGRYSTETDGLVLADQGAALEDFKDKIPGVTFLPDSDNVLPVLSEDWFDDDVVTGFRAWLVHVYGQDTLAENVRWLEESIGKDLRTYFCKDFYADHIKIYQKRPIYWMFQSPKKSFQCLIYMHRYTESTVGTILSGYLRELQSKLKNTLSALESHGTSAADVKKANKIRASIAELEDWERKVMKPLADERISIDLDDGVKVNYNKFPHALAKVAGLSEWR